jgi:transposase InsO family protein
MRENGIVGVHLRKTVRTTVPEPPATPVPDLIRRDFTASAPNTQVRRRHSPKHFVQGGTPTYLPVAANFFIWPRYWSCARNGWRGGR